MNKLSIFSFILLLLLSGCGGGSDTPVPHVEDDVVKNIELSKVTDLDEELEETSGMINVGGVFYTHNDSGNEPYLYEINTSSGEIVRTIHIDGAENTDWEDLAQDEAFVYIADIGNNLGNRKDLKIYKILKSSLVNSETVPSEIIEISYSDQIKFDYAPYETPYDAEALIAYKGALYLFSKNWNDYTTAIYTISTTPGQYQIQPIYKQKLNVMITGADFDSDTKSIVLIGYSNFFITSMVYVLSGYLEDSFFSGSVVAAEIENSMEAGQIEAVVFGNDNNSLFISAEGDPAILYKTVVQDK